MENSNQILDTNLEDKNINSDKIEENTNPNNNNNTTSIETNSTEKNTDSKIESTTETITEEIQSSPEISSNETSSETITIKPETANITNCLALTIKEDHKLVAVKNVFIKSIRMSWKVVVSSITLAILKLFA